MADMKASGPDRGRGLRGFEPDRGKIFVQTVPSMVRGGGRYQ
eukprot:CAMPEP_0118667014 /NCGR_PEP_ID=MMETSP0785-20121206/19544_1 /TAXON_ID=91992 /ORGANISM="Bolidomonas pacifica, Strain CCMP 1866" /LENGTH=41 /DNA_ID= /DNA_START= /DNA_END= /DNA_ORIENTATION=